MSGDRDVAVVKAETSAIMSKTSVGQPSVLDFIFSVEDREEESEV